MIGLPESIAGSYLSGEAASDRKNQLEELAAQALEGRDIPGIMGESLGMYETYFPRASAIGTQFNDYYAGQLNRLMEAAQPGYAGRQQQYYDLASRRLSGDLSDIGAEIMRSTAGTNVGSGLAGSQLGRNLTARDLGLGALQSQQMGVNMLGAGMNIFPHAQPTDINALAGFSPQEMLSQRNTEFAQYLNAATGAAMAPGMNEVMGQALSQFGGTAMGQGSSV